MVRAFANYGLIALLLACPYFCFGKPSEADARCAVACNSCCNKAPQKDEGNPHPWKGSEGPEQGHDGDCLCRGAVVEGLKADALRIAGGELARGAWVTVEDVALLSRCAAPSDPLCYPSSSLGRQVCILYAHLVI